MEHNIQKSELIKMKNDLKALLVLTENITSKYSSIFNEIDWLDNQDVCLMLDISKKTLLVYKDKGLLPFTRLNRKIYYKKSDVQALLKVGKPYKINNDGRKK